ncbi:MAG: KdsC family phosphatase [Terriglobales bacterium]
MATDLHLQLRPDAVARARRIRVVLFDVDGVLTEGKLWYFPDGHEGVVEVKAFSAHDGIGMALARRAGLKLGIITKRTSVSVALRARDLRLDYVYQGVDRKLAAFEEILTKSGCRAEQACCMGDDIVDLRMLEAGGLAAAPANAREEVRAAAHFVAAHAGGKGAARDLIEFILRAQGVYEETLQRYLAAPESDYAAQEKP